jgi:CBS domain-containing protein
MRISECMTPDVLTIRPDERLRDAAKLMLEEDIGVLPVADGDRLVGMITDRDIAVRGVAAGLDASTPIREVMTEEVLYCFEDQNVDDVAQNMSDMQVRRLPVVDRRKRLVGIITTGDLAREISGEACSAAMSGVAQPGGLHSQSPAV